MRAVVGFLDRYIVKQIMVTLSSVLAVTLSLMLLEHLPRLLALTRLSGHRGEIILNMLVALVPEYAGLGLLVGLLLALSLTVRRLELRQELEAIESFGIGPVRWLRMGLLLTLIVSGVVFIDQAWLLPAGEARLALIQERIEAGDYGFDLHPNEIVSLGKGMTLSFQSVGPRRNDLNGLFIADDERAYTALHGTLSIMRDGATELDLRDGRVVEFADTRSADFNRLKISLPGTGSGIHGKHPPQEAKQLRFEELFASPNSSLRAAAYGRLLWAYLVLLTPVLALSLARPTRRSNNAGGLLLALLLAVGAVKSIDFLEGETWDAPAIMAILLATIWTLIAVGLLLRAISKRRGKAGWSPSRKWTALLEPRQPAIQLRCDALASEPA